MKNIKHKLKVFTEYKNIELDNSFILEIQKAIFLALLERQQINIGQYNQAIELLSKKRKSDISKNK